MTPTPDNHEPADLSELTATDALLDRLGGRSPSDEDLLDPAAAVLTELTAVIDRSREQDVDAARLIEVLAGRPLYIAGADPATDEVPLMIDLTEHEPAPEQGAAGEAEPGNEQHGKTGEPELVPITRLPAPAVVPIRIQAPELADARRWDRARIHAYLPAASVLLLLAVGGGVSAAVTGNPLAPVDGINRVVAQIPGVDSSFERVSAEISAARLAALKSDSHTATMHLNKAKAGLSDVPESDKPQLSTLIDEVETLVPTEAPATPTAPGVVVSPGSGTIPGIVETSAPASADPTPPTTSAPAPTATSTAPRPTSEPSSDPVPTATTVAPEAASTKEAPIAGMTPAAVATSS